MTSRYVRLSRGSLLAGLSLVCAALACRDSTEESAPAPEQPSFAVSGPITWDTKSQMKQIPSSKGCDSYTPTWAPDGNLYTAVGDCRPKNVPVKVGMGFGRISGSSAYSVTFAAVATGDPADWDDAPDGAGAEAMGDGPASEKASGMLYVDGRLYEWIRNIFPGGIGTRLKYTSDLSATNPQFTWVDWSVPEVGYASFAQFGQSFANGPAYVYAVIPMRSVTAGSVSSSAYDLVPGFGLIRGSRTDLTLQGNWEYFCGTSSVPAWCSSPASATPILNKSKKFNPRAGMSWNPGIGRFMLSLTFDPSPSTTTDDRRFNGGLMVLLSSHPWGPWQLVFSSSGAWPGGYNSSACDTSKRWGAGERADIPPKFMSADGKTFYLFSSGGDCLSIARGRLP
ncbi:MAG TPA: hypothetical protein VFH40_00855 [Gemmatimonadales bacterium]|jgi:hypothetical protein|nr:hypothetical protein [Gemmatimonadales bacterium]